MAEKIYVDDLAYYLLNNAEHGPNYDANLALELANRRGEEIFILYYLTCLAGNFNIINASFENGLLEQLIDKNKANIANFKEKLKNKSDYTRYVTFIDEIIDMKIATGEFYIYDDGNVTEKR